MKKRIICILIAAIMVASLLPMTVFAGGGDFAITNGTPASESTKNNGYIAIDKESAALGAKVTVTIYPKDGYKLKSLTAAPVITTIADVLATVDGFPKDTSGGNRPTAPSNALSNESSNCAFAFDLNGNSYFILWKDNKTYKLSITTTEVTAGDNCYTASIANGTLTFNMKDGILTSIEHKGTNEKNKEYDGIYVPTTPLKPAPKPDPVKQDERTYTFTMPAANVTIKAAFEEVVPETYTVSFIMNGHGTQIPAQTVKKGSKLTKPADPKADGWLFKGWYLTKTGSDKSYDFTLPVESNLTLYAVWTSNPVSYKIIQGANQTVFINADQAVFASNADFSKFKCVKVDGVEVATSYYTVESGSTVITFNKKFISNKLNIGQHTLEIVSNDGSARTDFTVAEPLPKTGDSSTPFLWLGMCMLAIFSVLMLRKKAYRN